MPLRLANKTVSPPGGHRFRVEPLGRTFGGAGIYPDRSSLRSAMRQPLANAHLPMPTDEEIDEWMCREMPPGWCVDAATGMEAPASFQSGKCDLSFRQVISATRTLGYWATHGRPRVNGSVAEKRASICVTCVHNRPVEGCNGCNLRSLQDAIGAVVQGQALTADERLNGCCLCGCSLKAKVWLPLDVLLKYSTAQEVVREHAPWCWMVQEEEPLAA